MKCTSNRGESSTAEFFIQYSSVDEQIKSSFPDYNFDPPFSQFDSPLTDLDVSDKSSLLPNIINEHERCK